MRNFFENLKRAFRRPLFYVSMGIYAAIAAVISFLSGVNFLIIFPLVVAAMFINALVMHVEDNAPGGFANPTKEQTGLKKQD